MNKTEAQQLLHAAFNDPSRENCCAAFSAVKQAMGMTDLEIAIELQISRPTVGRWERGEAMMHPVGRPHLLNWFQGKLNDSPCAAHHLCEQDRR